LPVLIVNIYQADFHKERPYKEYFMERFILQSGGVTTVLDFTEEFFASLTSLVGLMSLVITMFAVITLRRYELKKQQCGPHEYLFADQRKTA